MTLPDSAYTRAGAAVTSLEQHKGLIRGTVVIGARQNGRGSLGRMALAK